MGLRIGLLDLSPANRKALRSDSGKVAIHKIMLLEPEQGREITANAFLVDQSASSTIRAHFHTNSQFQVFVGGSGQLGRKNVQGFVAQYVAPHTGYGPIVAGDHGIWYLTLRPSAASGAKYLPDTRAELDMTLPKRQVTSEMLEPGTPGEAPSVQEMIAPQGDGLAGWMVSVPAGRTVQAPEHAGGLARYYVVASGDIVVSGTHVGPLSVVWAEGDDINLPLQAGAKGANVIALQFPGNAF